MTVGVGDSEEYSVLITRCTGPQSDSSSEHADVVGGLRQTEQPCICRGRCVDVGRAEIDNGNRVVRSGRCRGGGSGLDPARDSVSASWAIGEMLLIVCVGRDGRAGVGVAPRAAGCW